ncbi:unnamed protein product [Pylaiella littoralis]
MKGFHGLLLVLGLGLLLDPLLGAAQTCSDGVTKGVDGNGVVCCAVGCTQCGGSGCTTAGSAANLDASACCGGAITASDVYCGNGKMEAPCILGFSPTAQFCIDGVTEGIDGNDVVCCPTGCTQCGGSGCTTA